MLGHVHVTQGISSQALAVTQLNPSCPWLNPSCPRLPAELHHIRAPLVDLEVRGVPALQYFGNVIWTDDVFEKLNAGADRNPAPDTGQGAPWDRHPLCELCA